MKSITFKGITVEYDERCLRSYRWNKAIGSGDQARSSKAVERLFCGKDEYYAYVLSDENPMSYEEWLETDDSLLDDFMGDFADLLKAVMEDAGQLPKN